MIVTGIYFAVALLCVWPVYRLVLDWAKIGGYNDGADHFMSIVTGCFAAACWPIALVALAAFWLSRAIWTRLLDLDDKRERVS